MVYRAEGKSFSFSQQTKVYDSFDDEIFEIKKNNFSWKTTFFILKDGKRVYKVFQKIFSTRLTVFVESLTEIDAFYVEGNFWGREYNFYTEGKNIATVSKKLFSLSDLYGITIEEGHDEQLILTVLIIIDMIRDNMKKAAANN